MRVDYEFNYEVNYMLAGGQRPSTKIALEGGLIDIPETTSDAAPLAARYSCFITSFAQGTETRELRLFEGHLFKPVANLKTADNESNSDAIRDAIKNLTKATSPSSKVPSAKKVSHSLGDTRLQAQETVQAELERLLLLDGVPYIRCQMPKLEISHPHNRDFLLLRMAENFRYEGRPNQIGLSVVRSTLYSLNEYEKVLQRLNAGTPDFYHGIQSLEVYIPEAFEFDKYEEMVGRTVNQALVDNYEIDHKLMEPHLRKDLIDVEVQYKRWRRGAYDVDIVDLLERLYVCYTSGKFYHQDLAGEFFESYDKCKTIIPEMQLNIAGL